MHHTFKFFITLCMFTVLFADEIELPTHEIYFTGQKHFNEADLQDALGVDTPSFFQFWKDDTPRIEDKLRSTLEPSLKSFYNAEGFYDANFTIEETNTTIFVYISENKPVRVRDINISSDYDISSMIKMKKDDIFQAEVFVSIKNEIIKQLLKDGYCSYDLDSKAYVDLDEHAVDVHYNLRKGGICTFGKLTTKGLNTIDDDVIASRVRAREGERFSPELVQETSDELYRLSAFDSVRINVNRKFYNVVPVDIEFIEMEKPYRLEAGAGYDTYVGARIRSEITRNNFMGNAQKITFKASWSDIEQVLALEFFKPVLLTLLDFPIDFGTDIGYSNLEYEGFTEEKTYARAYLAYQHGRVKLRSGLALEHIIISDVDESSLERAVNEGTFDLFYPYVGFVYDARDSRLNPKYGYYLSAYGEFGSAQDEDSSIYMKTLFEGRLIHTFSDVTLSAVGKVGIVDTEDKEGIPESKYFFGGGTYSNRAYGFREIGVIISPTEHSINGASTMLNLSLEANFPTRGNVYGAVFTDNTMLTEDSYDFTGDVISTAGFGVRYMTPIGPLKLDVGFNVNDPSQHGISFQVGQSF